MLLDDRGRKMRKNKITFLILLVLLLSTLSTVITYAKIQPGEENNVDDKDKAMIIVGDSRVMHMDYLVGAKSKKNTYLIHHNGGNINCISSSSYSPVADWLPKALNKYPNAPVTLWLGENGASWTKEKQLKNNYDMIIKKYPTHTFFVMTVGPDGSATGTYSNKNVLKVNEHITKRYLTDASKTQDEIGSDNFEFYDMYSYMVNDLGLDIPKNGKDANGKGYSSDLTHYTSSTSKKVIKQMMKVMEGKVSASTTGSGGSSNDQDNDNDDGSGGSGGSGSNGGSGDGQLKDFDLIKGENELKDMPKPSKLPDSREDINKIANKNQVSTTDYMSSDYIKEGIDAQKENRRIRITRVIYLFAALCLIEYSVLLLLAYLFDIASIFGSVSLLNVVTFGRIHYAAAPTDVITDEMKAKYKVMTFKHLLLDMAILNIIAAVMIEGSVFYWVYRLIIFGRSLF